MLISHTRQFAYVSPPKTASTTLHVWLSQPALCKTRWRPNPLTQHAMDIPAPAAGYFCFASIRHPWDRAVSLWAYCLAHGGPDLTFAEFIHDWQPTAGWFYGRSQADFLRGLRLDAMIRVERLRSDVMTLPPIRAAIREGAKLRPLPRMNATRHPPWQQVVTPELQQVLASRWPDDLNLWEAAGTTATVSALDGSP